MRIVLKNKLTFCNWLGFVVLLMTFIGCQDDKVIPAPEIYLNMPEGGYEIDYDSTLVITPQITYDYNSTYQWILDGNVASTEKNLTIKADTLSYLEYTFIVSTSTGSDTMKVPVYALRIIDFEELLQTKDSVLCNVDINSFTSKGVSFPYKYYPNDTTWQGYAFSSMTDKSTRSKKNQYSAYPGSGADKSNAYAVYHQLSGSASIRIVFENNLQYRIKSVDVVNSTYMIGAIKYEVDVENAFGSGKKDAFILGFKGVKSDGTETPEYYMPLADYTFDNVKERFAIDAWTTANLDVLGRVNQLILSVYSSESPQTLSYFCLDNLKLMD